MQGTNTTILSNGSSISYRRRKSSSIASGIEPSEIIYSPKHSTNRRYTHASPVL